MNNFNEQTIIGGLKSLGPKPLKVVKTWVPGFYTDEEFINFINKSEHLYIVDGKVEYVEHKNLNDESENFVHSDKSNINEQNFSKTITNLNNNYIKLELDSDLLYTSPMQYVIDKEVYKNSKGTWIHLFYNLIDFFDKHEPVIFCKYIDYINNKSLNNYNFIDTFISDIQTRYIKSQKKYLFRSGHEGSEEISRWILDMLSFFNYKSRCSIYGTKKK